MHPLTKAETLLFKAALEWARYELGIIHFYGESERQRLYDDLIYAALDYAEAAAECDT